MSSTVLGTSARTTVYLLAWGVLVCSQSLAAPISLEDPVSLEDPGSFEDPAPPERAKTLRMDAPTPSPHPGGTYLATPKKRHADAVHEEWPMFLGAHQSPRSAETHLLKNWKKGGPDLLWTIARGESYACPAIASGRLIHFHRLDDQEVVECLDATSGHLIWTFEYPTAYRDAYNFGVGPKCAPIITNDKVVTYGIEGWLHCFNLANGQVLWKRNLKGEFKIPDLFFGVGASPILVGDMIIINVGGQEGPSVGGFSLETGKLMWGTGKTWGASYASPVFAAVHDQERIFVLTGGKSRPSHGGLMIIDPVDGALDFSHPFRGRRYESANAANPVVSGNAVMISSSYNTGSICFEISEDLEARERWKTDLYGSHFNTGIVKDDHLYAIDGMAGRASSLVCFDWLSGEEVWRERPEWEEAPPKASGRQPGRYSIGLGTLLDADGDVLALGEAGHLLWLRMNPEGVEILSRTWLFQARETWTPPVISNGLLYVCQNQRGPDGPRRLLCYDLRRE